MSGMLDARADADVRYSGRKALRALRLLATIARRVTGPYRRIVTATILGSALVAGLSFASLRWADSHAAAVSDVSAAQAAQTHAGLLARQLQTFRLLPLVLAEYPDVHDALEKNDPDAATRLNGKLELLASRTDAAAIYVLRADGRSIAASNWRRLDSFVGYDWRYRSYFVEALRHGAAELFALGTVSHRPGLYIARRIGSARRPKGVIVAKVEFDRLEAGWARQAGPTFVTDRDGVVIITSRPEWRFHTLQPLTPKKVATAARNRQFGNLPLRRIELDFDGATVRRTMPSGEVAYRAASIPVPLSGGKLRFLQPMAPAVESATASARLLILVIAIVVVGIVSVMVRARERARMQVATRRLLEREVTARTAELTELNRLLIEQSRERERADRNLRLAREELAQANRLASIGQITASVAHEINQPVAAIQTFAENARKFIDRERPDRARANLDVIADLTARIGTITAELRSYARRGAASIAAVEVGAAIDGSLLLLGDRMRSQGVVLERSGERWGVRVAADRVGLEQVLINLLQNALEALDGHAAPRLRIAVAFDGAEHVIVTVCDNGPGIPAELADRIFAPFVTGRPNGLGLGLGIARDIAREFGGELEINRSTLGGAGFRLSLRRV